MYEIEIKFKFKNKTITQIQEMMSRENIEWSQPINQSDTIFLSNKMKEYKIVNGTQILRIREESRGQESATKKILTMKVQQEIALESKEFELEISNSEQAQLIIEELGFIQFVNVVKSRKKAKVNNYNLCLDEVEGLGTFLEVEYLSKEKVDALEVQNKITEWVEGLGLTDYEINKIPYDTQVYNLKKQHC